MLLSLISLNISNDNLRILNLENSVTILLEANLSQLRCHHVLSDVGGSGNWK
jgi:hypothetical protein